MLLAPRVACSPQHWTNKDDPPNSMPPLASNSCAHLRAHHVAHSELAASIEGSLLGAPSPGGGAPSSGIPRSASGRSAATSSPPATDVVATLGGAAIGEAFGAAFGFGVGAALLGAFVSCASVGLDKLKSRPSFHVVPVVVSLNSAVDSLSLPSIRKRSGTSEMLMLVMGRGWVAPVGLWKTFEQEMPPSLGTKAKKPHEKTQSTSDWPSGL
mmetsp:Transcript_61000/g.122277  ORF Transcript_61000/g.122277 Transcript_61000/m.122277 type:complete len:212 (+) Transcript_61000:111-746(+)